jgi:hypothetical protein
MKWNHEINRPGSYQEAVDWFDESQAELAAVTKENTRLRGLLGEIESEINKAPCNVSFDYIAAVCKRINEGSE